MPLRLSIAAATATAALTPAGVVHAFDLGDGELTIGVVLDRVSSEFRDEDDEFALSPFIEFSIGRFSFYSLGATVELWSWEGSPATGEPDGESDWAVSVDADLSIGEGKREQGDDTIFAGMHDRDEDTVLSIGAEWLTPVGLLALDVGVDVGRGSGGTEATLGGGVPLLDIGPVETFLEVGVRHEDGKRVAHEYGVRADEARADRAAYAPTGTFTPFVGVGAGMAFGRGWAIDAEVGAERVDDGIRRSPLTDDEAWRTGFGISISRTFGG